MSVTYTYLSNSTGLEGTVSNSFQLEKFNYPHVELLIPGIGLHGCDAQIVACSVLLPRRPDEKPFWSRSQQVSLTCYFFIIFVLGNICQLDYIFRKKGPHLSDCKLTLGLEGVRACSLLAWSFCLQTWFFHPNCLRKTIPYSFECSKCFWE